MNRAWIPAGALAGVSVAGLLALGPLTDSMGTQVAFPEPVTVKAPVPNDFLPVSLDVSDGTVGSVRTASLPARGDRATAPPRGGDFGFVALPKKNAATAQRAATVTSTQSTTTTAKPKKVKKTVKRQSSIGGAGETSSNPTTGFAGGTGSAPTGDGEASGTPGGN